VKKITLFTAILAGCTLFAKPSDISKTPAPVTNTPPSNVTKQKCNDSDKDCLIRSDIRGKKCILRIEAEGVGVPPCEGACSVAQARVMARRAAIVDAYKSLAEKMYGIKINGRDTVKNMILQNSNLRAYVYGLIRGATIEDEEFKNGVYKVVLSVKLDPNEWNKFLKNIPDSYLY
jgi:hypothetical protein